MQIMLTRPESYTTMSGLETMAEDSGVPCKAICLGLPWRRSLHTFLGR